ncbi:MAG: stage III sporulation protein AG [Caldibacillus debilis]|jgi:stage III sporulation protein AG|uniref:Stage III sporulation protein AG n=1 Tax=Caldibacillus debilis TaxID=301148 RepID=A0A3E0K301_9BACI|nr:stage III sporulation protein AG [Caldibacillus debilis]MBO2481588.1 stage III sporulation protein AG [Bacillaceae bacterium]MBY6273064.1 stage III sporulation protein AG [Bacillaceae bacterium]OUM88293.1 MAG: stage III sporulation protein AG [Caldibacillus debilis]REJ27248.1 MAG: stage III sporulation protein AG [Caldibacillus debilis]REJ28202.1 MAG: stage III sporulation protein AG [Caldibacillus debilis]
MKLFGKISEILSGWGDEKKKSYFLVILVLGIALMIAGNIFRSDESAITEPSGKNPGGAESRKEQPVSGNEAPNQASGMADYESYYENELKKALESIAGVGDVTVLINVGSTEKKIYEKNTVKKKQVTNEKDTNGGEREIEDETVEEQMVIIREGDKEVPLVSETKKPEISGVLVVAKGAEQIQIRKMILEACMKVLDVPSHRISIMAKK